jgi:hypothetical protein
MDTRKPLIKPYLIFLTILSICVIVSCRPEPVAPDDARILILDPPAGATLPAGDVTIQTFSEYIELVDKAGQNREPGQGHIVYYMDITPPVTKGESALTNPGTYFVTTASFHVWNKVAPGNHIFWVQLVNNDNTPLEPPSAVRVPVTISP